MKFKLKPEGDKLRLIPNLAPPGKCELCGKVAELRPYGPKGENICQPCGQKDPAATERRMLETNFGEHP